MAEHQQHRPQVAGDVGDRPRFVVTLSGVGAVTVTSDSVMEAEATAAERAADLAPEIDHHVILDVVATNASALAMLADDDFRCARCAICVLTVSACTCGDGGLWPSRVARCATCGSPTKAGAGSFRFADLCMPCTRLRVEDHSRQAAIERQLRALRRLLSDPIVKTILIADTAPATVERNTGGTLQVALELLDDDALATVLDAVIAPIGYQVDPTRPLTAGLLPNGFRFSIAIVPPEQSLAASFERVTAAA